MILYYSPGACSLADHIALNEADLTYRLVKVDLKAKRTEDGDDYAQINPKGYVPALGFDDGLLLTENIAILSWIADQAPGLKPNGEMGTYRLLETLAYISTELHKSFKPFFKPGTSDAEKSEAGATIDKRLGLLAPRLAESDYLFGANATVADAYLFVMLTWARKNGLTLSPPIADYFDRMSARPAVRRAMEQEGLTG